MLNILKQGGAKWLPNPVLGSPKGVQQYGCITLTVFRPTNSKTGIGYVSAVVSGPVDTGSAEEENMKQNGPKTSQVSSTHHINTLPLKTTQGLMYKMHLWQPGLPSLYR